MEEKEKYYIPDIEEFHVGFEYEYKSTFLDGVAKTQRDYDINPWVKDVTFASHDFPYIERALTGRNATKGLCGIRVKYLDQEDIESLGWKYSNEKIFNDHIVITFIQDKYILTFESPRKLISVLQRHNDRIVEHSFISEVKNKSELKKLMKQLDIKQWVN